MATRVLGYMSTWTRWKVLQGIPALPPARRGRCGLNLDVSHLFFSEEDPFVLIIQVHLGNCFPRVLFTGAQDSVICKERVLFHVFLSVAFI